MSQSLTYLINDKAVYRTAPATPGQLIIVYEKTVGILVAYCNIFINAKYLKHLVAVQSDNLIFERTLCLSPFSNTLLLQKTSLFFFSRISLIV